MKSILWAPRLSMWSWWRLPHEESVGTNLDQNCSSEDLCQHEDSWVIRSWSLVGLVVLAIGLVLNHEWHGSSLLRC